IFGTESLDPLNFSGAKQRPIQPIRPAVIAAAKQLARTASLRRWSRAMAAHVIKPAQFAIAAAHNQQRLAQQFGGEVISGIRHLVTMSYHLPASREDSFFLGREGSPLSVKMRGQGPRLSDIGINRNYIFRNSHRIGFSIVRRKCSAG